MARRADTRYLRDVAYANPSGLAARASLYDFQQPYIDIVAEALTVLAPVDGRVVGDVGCGSGRYIDALRGAGAYIVGIDLSVGMLAGVQTPPPLVAADGQSLPLTPASFDVVMMMHMLCLRVSLEDAGLVNPRVTAEDARRFIGVQFGDPDVHSGRAVHDHDRGRVHHRDQVVGSVGATVRIAAEPDRRGEGLVEHGLHDVGELTRVHRLVGRPQLVDGPPPVIQ